MFTETGEGQFYDGAPPRYGGGLHWLEDPRIPLKWTEVANEHAIDHHLRIA